MTRDNEKPASVKIRESGPRPTVHFDPLGRWVKSRPEYDPTQGDNGKWEFHPFADLFPLMDENSPEFKGLVDDIRDHGVTEPVWIFEGMILDGRNRYRAAKITKRSCPAAIWDSRGNLLRVKMSPLDFVISNNLHRRHLTDDQRAMVAAKMLPLLKAEGKGRMSAGGEGGLKPDDLPGRSDDRAAQTAKVSRHKVRKAADVLKADPEVAAEVASGKTKLSVAKRTVRASDKYMPAAAKRAAGKRPRLNRPPPKRLPINTYPYPRRS